jgi:hypothetical protein
VLGEIIGDLLKTVSPIAGSTARLVSLGMATTFPQPSREVAL